GAVVHVVRVEAGADELLEEIGLFVGALRGAEAGDRARAVLGVDPHEAQRDEVEGLLPRRLAEVREHFGVVDEAAGLTAALAALPLALRVLRVGVHAVVVVRAAGSGGSGAVGFGACHIAADVGGQGALGVGLLAADQRHGEALLGGGVVPAVASL